MPLGKGFRIGALRGADAMGTALDDIGTCGVDPRVGGADGDLTDAAGAVGGCLAEILE